jgi:hypothetical protein
MAPHGVGGSTRVVTGNYKARVGRTGYDQHVRESCGRLAAASAERLRSGPEHCGNVVQSTESGGGVRRPAVTRSGGAGFRLTHDAIAGASTDFPLSTARSSCERHSRPTEIIVIVSEDGKEL